MGSQLQACGLYKNQRRKPWSCGLGLAIEFDPWILKTSPSSLPLATCLMEQKVTIPMDIYFSTEIVLVADTVCLYQWRIFRWKVKRAALPKQKTTQQMSFACLLNSFTLKHCNGVVSQHKNTPVGHDGMCSHWFMPYIQPQWGCRPHAFNSKVPAAA